MFYVKAVLLNKERKKVLKYIQEVHYITLWI